MTDKNNNQQRQDMEMNRAMIMPPRVRKFALTAHITSSVGWLGAVVGILAHAIAGLTSQDAQIVRSAYLVMELTGWFVLVPLSFASLLTGLIQSLGTAWGLFKHYWVLVKLVLTVLATVILLMYMQTLSHLADAARDATLSVDNLRNSSPLVHAGAALLVLLAAITLSVYKPWGRIRYGRRNPI